MNNLFLGYSLDFLNQFGYAHIVKVNLKVYPHLLLAGSSGSGKSYALNIYIEQLKKMRYDVCICDYKGELPGCNFKGDAVFDGISMFYKNYKNKALSCLVVDEYPAYLAYLKLIDANKAKKVKEMIAEMLMMARSYNSPIWLVTQRPDADLFIGGARDNLHIKILFGNGSSEAKTMLFGSEKIEKEYYQVGQGLYSIAGSKPHSLLVPKLR